MLRLCLLCLVLSLTSCVTPKAVQEPKPQDLVTNTDSEFHQRVSDADNTVSPSFPTPLEPANLAALPDVWMRIQQQISINVPDRPEIAAERAFYSRQQKFLNQVALNADPFFYYVVTRLEQRGMPVELALIPIVESAYNPKIKGRGVSGLWQMAPQTAKNFGLKSGAISY